MAGPSDPPLRRGWTTGACATAATRGALERLWGGGFPDRVRLVLPKGETPVFALEACAAGPGWAECAVVKDAGDDPDVTHGARIVVRADAAAPGAGIVFRAGEGVGVVTRPGLPLAVGEPAINPVPRQMMAEVAKAVAERHGVAPDAALTVSVPGGRDLAGRTWNPRLGIEGGISILGTTGVVRPFSCAAWIASIHRGIDVARAGRLSHVAGCTGATSETAVQALHQLPDHAMLDMGDFAGGLVKYLVAHPVPRLTIGGGIAKISKLAQGARDLHSRRAEVDLARLAARARAVGLPDPTGAQTALEALCRAGPGLAQVVAEDALAELRSWLGAAPIAADVVVVDRAGAVIGHAGAAAAAPAGG